MLRSSLLLLVAGAASEHCGGTACRGMTNELNTEYIQASMNGMDRYVQRALDRGAARYHRSDNHMKHFGETPEQKTLLSEGGCTAMHMASFFGHLSTVRLLLANDFDLREAAAIGAEQNNHGATPLMLAAVKGDKKIVAALLYHGSDPATQDHDGKTAEDHAANEDILALLKGTTKPAVHYTPDPPKAPELQPPCVDQEGGCSEEEQKAWDDGKHLRDAKEHVHGNYYPIDGKMHEYDAKLQKYTPVLDQDGDVILADDVLKETDAEGPGAHHEL